MLGCMSRNSTATAYRKRTQVNCLYLVQGFDNGAKLFEDK